MSNTNPNTGIRYGTIYLNNLNSDLAHDLWIQGTNVSEEEAYKEARAEITRNVEEEIEAGTFDGDEEDIEGEVDYRLERLEINVEEPYIEGACEGVKYGISHLGGAALLWVFESPVISTARLCSPCVPGAIDLDSLDDDGYEGYGIPDDWRDKE